MSFFFFLVLCLFALSFVPHRDALSCQEIKATEITDYMLEPPHFSCPNKSFIVIS